MDEGEDIKKHARTLLEFGHDYTVGIIIKLLSKLYKVFLRLSGCEALAEGDGYKPLNGGRHMGILNLVGGGGTGDRDKGCSQLFFHHEQGGGRAEGLAKGIIAISICPSWRA